MLGALTGVRVIDFTRMPAGPLCAVLLRELGARVIKVDFREGGDVVRAVPSLIGGAEGYLCMAVNRGRRGVTLDLKFSEARQVALDLIAKADMLVENFAPGVMKKLGLDYEAARKVNPGLIYCSMPGFGRENGPGASLTAFDREDRAMGGLTSAGVLATNPPAGFGSPVAGMGGGLYEVVAVLASLNRRKRTGGGRYINISMQDCISSYNSLPE